MKLPAKKTSAHPASGADARPFIKGFADITLGDIPNVGGKNDAVRKFGLEGVGGKEAVECQRGRRGW